MSKLSICLLMTFVLVSCSRGDLPKRAEREATIADGCRGLTMPIPFVPDNADKSYSNVARVLDIGLEPTLTIYIRAERPTLGWAKYETEFRVSHDYGKTWSQLKREIPTPLQTPLRCYF